jgi:toxin ParE1/3/4
LTVTYSALAERELEEIGLWIARDNPVRAITYVEELRAACDGIGDHPGRYPIVGGSPPLRKKLFYPYLILYRERRNGVLIVSVRHGRRDSSTLR